MISIFKRHHSFFFILGVFVLLNILLYLIAARYNRIIPFTAEVYTTSAHHYLVDPRIHGGAFNFLNALGQFDAQWYLKIAADGYPTSPPQQMLSDKEQMGGLRYAFYPLYPLSVSAINTVLRNVELSAFVVSNILLLLNFVSLYFVVSKTYNKQLAAKATFLLFLFPFSVFFRSYFAEGLFLFLLIWFTYFLTNKKVLLAAVFLCLLNVTKANGMLLNIFFLFVVVKDMQHKRITLIKGFTSLIVAGLAYIAWVGFVYTHTGDPFYFYSVLKAWYTTPLWPPPPFYNIAITLVAIRLPFMHTVHFSQIDIVSMLISGYILFKSKKFLKSEWWWISFLLWILPVTTRDLASFSRYQTVLFPLFVYIAHQLENKKLYLVTAILFSVGLIFTFLFFVSWHWVG